jgi:anti-sigma regulatory factor (Ser/Thr protein kinase)
VDRFTHEAAFYAGAEGLVRSVLPFVREGVQRGEPVLVAMRPERLSIIERALGGHATRVDLVDMHELGRNPACIIPEWRRFLNDTRGDGPVRGVGEPIWAGRRSVELVEASLHEALLNVAFDNGPAWHLLCPYDVSSLPPEVIEDARRNHPSSHPGDLHEGYGGHRRARSLFEAPLDAPPADAYAFCFEEADLAGLRGILRRIAEESGVGADRADDLVLAAHELAANSVVHGGGRGVLRAWTEHDAFVVDVRDTGVIRDTLVGRELLDGLSEDGRGVWMANQLCDLVQVRSSPSGTQVRFYAWR